MPEKPQRQHVLRPHHADVDVALLEDAVVGEQPVEVVDHAEERIAPRPDVVDQRRRQVLVHAADPEIVGVHARAGGALVEPEDLLALLKDPQRRRQRADVERVRADIEQVVGDSRQLRIEHADQLGAVRHREAEQPLDRQHEGVLAVHRRDVVEPVEIRHRLEVGLVLDQLLGAAVQQADMRIGALDHLAVQLEDQPQHAMRGRVLRAKIDGEVASRGVGAHVLLPQPGRLAFSSPGSTSQCLPRARGNRSCGTPASAAPARRPRASARRRSAARHSR